MRWSEPAAAGLPATIGMAAVAALLSALGSAWAISHARHRGLIDHPGERRNHAEPTPRGGGIGIFAACLLATLALAAGSGASFAWAWVAAGLLVVALAGGWDDHRPLPAWPRLLAHALAAACLAQALRLQGADLAVVIVAAVNTPLLITVTPPTTSVFTPSSAWIEKSPVVVSDSFDVSEPAGRSSSSTIASPP